MIDLVTEGPANTIENVLFFSCKSIFPFFNLGVALPACLASQTLQITLLV